MNELYEKSLHKLELDKVLCLLADQACSASGKEQCLKTQPLFDADEIRLLQKQTSAACRMITLKGSPGLAGVSDVGASVDRAVRGGCLSPEELLRVAGVLKCARQAKAYADGEGMENDLNVFFAQITPNKYLEERIFTSIVSKDELADAASPELASIRRKIRRQSVAIREGLQKIITSPTYAKFLQEPIVTIRSDRFVVPVKAECKGSIPGLVHDVSSSGSTFFIEPMQAVNGNNALRELFVEERKEIERILTELSGEVAGHREHLAINYTVLTQLDCIFARAKLSFAMKATEPEIRTDGRLELKRARHPLITGKTVVPISVRLGSDFDTLIITGPNTGGKTVTLKTTGLFTLMAQSGLQVPAEHGTELAVFDDVFADIGDEQSIEQSLSTFSGHMTNIVSILTQVTPDSLVLFDELGAGTDPTEGAALAQAILSTLLDMHTRTVATTHYSELKEYALTTENVENASVEFDVTTLRPTYRLSIGIPGKSNAFEISRKLGLPEFVIGKAKELLSKEQVRFEDVIANAEYHRQVAERERQIAEEASREMVAIRNQAEAERRKLEEQRERSIKKAKEEAKRIVENARRESDAIIAELRAMKKAGGAQEHEIQRVRKQVDTAQEALADKPEEAAGEVPKSVKVGDMVHIASMDVDATVMSLPDAKGYLQLKVGMMKMRAQMSDLRTLSSTQKLIKKEQKKQEHKRAMREQRVDVMTRPVRQELDVRGMALDEAIPEVQKFLDDAMLSSLGEVSIIHGNGTGILRAGIQDCLRRHPCVSSFRLGRYGEGETGVTIVSLK